MPDILIRGMEMPDSCEFCRFHGYGGYEFERVVCSLTGRSKEKPIFSRFDDCPFIGIPPHGDLIDRDQLAKTLDYYIREAGWGDEINKALGWVRDDFIKGEAVIVPASEEETNHENP